MKGTRIVFAGGILILVLACALWLSRSGDKPSESSASDAQTVGEASSDSDPGNGKAGQNSRKTAGPALGLRSARTIGLPGVFNLDTKKVKAFMGSNPDDPGLLASAALWTNDPEIWKALREKAKVDKLAAAALALDAPSAQERLDSALLLAKSDPGNGLSSLAAAEASFQLGDREGALNYLREAAHASRFDLYSSQYAQGQEAILGASGLDDVEKGVLLAGNPWQQKAVGIIGVLGELSQKEADGDIAANTAGEMMDILDRLREGVGPVASFATLRRLSSAEEMLLRGLGPDATMTDGATTRSRARELGEKQIEMTKRAASVRELLETSSYDVAEDYYRIATSRGEMEASKWLLGN